MTTGGSLFKRLIIVSLFILFFLAIPHALHAAVYYVSQNTPGASDSNPGTEALPWLTLKRATDHVVAGDTVYVKAGTYIDTTGHEFNPVNNGTSDAHILFKAYPGTKPTIKTNAEPGYHNYFAWGLIDKSYIDLDGFLLIGGVEFWNLTHHCSVKNCEITYGFSPDYPGIPFENGFVEVFVGDVIKVADGWSGGTVHTVKLVSGSWGAGTAAGFLGLNKIANPDHGGWDNAGIGYWTAETNKGQNLLRGETVVANIPATCTLIDYSLTRGIGFEAFYDAGFPHHITVSNNYIHDLFHGNHTANTKGIYLFSYASENIIEYNTIDGYSADDPYLMGEGIGTKGGGHTGNIYRYNFVNNFWLGIDAEGSTAPGTYFDDHGEISHNVISDSFTGISLRYDVRWWNIYNNSIRAKHAIDSQLAGNIANVVFNNLAVWYTDAAWNSGLDYAFSAGDNYETEFAYKDFDQWYGYTNWSYTLSLANFQSAHPTLDQYSTTTNPGFLNASGNWSLVADFKRSSYPADGRNSTVKGAYITGSEIIGATGFSFDTTPPSPPTNVIVG